MYKTTPEYYTKFQIDYTIDFIENQDAYLEHWAIEQVCTVCAYVHLSVDTIRHGFTMKEEESAEVAEDTVKLFYYIANNTELIVHQLVALGYLKDQEMDL